LGKVADAFLAYAIGRSTAAGGTRFTNRLGLGFNIIQGSMVRMENRERRRGGEDIGAGDESEEEDSWSRRRRYALEYGNIRLGV
jgi:hypothetical protein